MKSKQTSHASSKGRAVTRIDASMRRETNKGGRIQGRDDVMHSLNGTPAMNTRSIQLINKALRGDDDTSGSSPSGSKPSEGPKDVSSTMRDSETQISKDPAQHATLPYLVTQTRDDLDGGDSNDDHSVRSKSSRQSVSRFAQRLVDKTRKTVSFSANVEGPGGIIMPMLEGRHGPHSISTSSSSLLWSCPSSASLLS
jgi:hypothetical protein